MSSQESARADGQNAGGRPDSRLSEDEIADLKVVVADSLADDTRQAMEDNFPPEQLPRWDLVASRLTQGFISLHELRSSSTGELLSSRMIVDYPSRKRGEPQFLLVSFVVTPDGGSVTKINGINGDKNPQSRQSKSKGYGSYLRQKSMEISRRQKPHALGLVAERESPKGVDAKTDQRVRRASWMSRLGLLVVADLTYDIPPLVAAGADQSKYLAVAERSGPIKPADLMIYRFDGKDVIDGQSLKSIVSRLYSTGYGIRIDDPFFVQRMEQLDEKRDYMLVGS